MTRNGLLKITSALSAALCFSGCSLFSPAEQVKVPSPIFGVSARVEVWGNTSSEGRFEFAVETPHGSEKHKLWEDWGPAQRVSIYVTPDKRFVALGGGGIAEMFAVSPQAKPEWIPYAQRPKENGENWIYLGAVDRHARHLVFYEPSQQQECVPLYGAGSSPYRQSHQNGGHC
jgi:hypothetical protein